MYNIYDVKYFQPEYIKTIEFDISTVCNARCPLCMRQSERFSRLYGTKMFRNIDDIIRQVEEYPKVENIYLIGQMSEPTLHPYFLDLVQKLKQKHLKLKICTNGSTRDKQFWYDLGEILDENDRVWFAICGSTQELHEKYRIGTNLSKILDNAQTLRQQKPVDGIKCIRFRYNSDDFASESFKSIVNQFSFVEFTETSIQNYVNSDFLPTKDILTAYNKVDTISKHMCKLYSSTICQSVMDGYIQIDPFGKIFPCYRFLEHTTTDWDGDYSKIEHGHYHFCRFCNEKVIEYIDNQGLNAII